MSLMKIRSILLISLIPAIFMGCSSDQKDSSQNTKFQNFKKRDFKTDSTINPCENFYKYVCNQTISNFKLPANRSSHGFSFDDIKEYLLDQKKDYFTNLRKVSASSPEEKMIKSYYLSCMNKSNSIDSEKKLISSTVEKVEKISDREHFSNFIFDNMKAGNPSFLSLWANLPNFENSEKMDVYFDIDLLSLPEKSYYKNTKITKDLQDLIASLFANIGLNNVRSKAKKVIDFEKALAEKFLTQVQINKRVFSLTRMPDKTRSLNNLKIGKYIAELPGKPHVRDLFGHDAYEFIDKQLSNANLETLKLIYLYHSLRKYMDDAYPEFMNKSIKFSNTHFGGPSQRPDRQERCTKEAESKFGMELDYILFPKLFPNFPVRKVKKMVLKIKDGLLSTIEKNVWLTPAAKNAALKKIKHLNIRLIAPESDQEWNFTKAGKYSSSNIVFNRRLYRQLKHQKFVEDLTKEIKDPLWSFGPLTVNAALLPPYNAIIFPVSMFLPPFYDPELPEEVNMAAIGTVIGHELGHAIDDKGYTFDFKGRVKPWIKEKDEKEFIKRTKPLIAQFDDIGHDGSFTLGENIGDLVGLTNSYEVAFAKKAKPASLKRQFFIQYGKLWCEVERPKVSKLRLKTDPHSLGFARSNEQVKHQPGFAEAFNCNAKDSMVLPEKDIIRIW